MEAVVSETVSHLQALCTERRGLHLLRSSWLSSTRPSLPSLCHCYEVYIPPRRLIQSVTVNESNAHKPNSMQDHAARKSSLGVRVYVLVLSSLRPPLGHYCLLFYCTLQVDIKPLLPFAPSLWALPPSTLVIQSEQILALPICLWSPFPCGVTPLVQSTAPTSFLIDSVPGVPETILLTPPELRLNGSLQAVASACDQLGWETWSDAGVKEDLPSGWVRGGERLFQAGKQNA